MSRASFELLPLLVAVIALCLALFSVALVVLPRTKGTTPNRFSWPWLASVTDGEVLERARLSPGVDDAWLQARTLAVVAAHKYTWLERSMIFGGISAVAFAIWRAKYAQA